jgi:hypothetical protein
MKDWRIIIAGIVAVLTTVATSIIAAYKGITISSLAGTPYEPLLILTGASTSLAFFLTKKWAIPSLFIGLLVSFSLNTYPEIHNISATLFYASSFILIAIDKHIRWLRFILILPALAAINNLISFEVVGNLILIVYHMYYIFKRVNIQ